MLSANQRHLVQRPVRGTYRLTVRTSKSTPRMAATVTVDEPVTDSLEPEKPDVSVFDTLSSEEDDGTSRDELDGFRESTFMSILRYEIHSRAFVNVYAACVPYNVVDAARIPTVLVQCHVF